MKKYLVERCIYGAPLNEYGTNRAYDSVCEVFDTLEDANKAARADWDHMSERDRECSEIDVLSVDEKDLSDWAIDDETGEIDWSAYANADYPKGSLHMTGLNPYNVRGYYMARTVKDVIKAIKYITQSEDCEDDRPVALADSETGFCCLYTDGEPDFYRSFAELQKIENITCKGDPESFWSALARAEWTTPEKLEAYNDEQLSEAVTRNYSAGVSEFIADLAYEFYDHIR